MYLITLLSLLLLYIYLEYTTTTTTTKISVEISVIALDDFVVVVLNLPGIHDKGKGGGVSPIVASRNPGIC